MTSKTLRDFPLYSKAILEIMLDQSVTGMVIMPDAEVPDFALTPLETAERWLAVAQLPENSDPLKLLPGHEQLTEILEGLEPDADWGHTFYNVVMPVDDVDQELLAKMGAAPLEIFAFKYAMNEFFDGELRYYFQGAVKGSTYHKMCMNNKTRMREPIVCDKAGKPLKVK